MADETQNRIYNVQINAPDALKTLAELKLRSQELREEQKSLGKVTEENAEEYYRLDNEIKAINSEANKYQRQIQNNIKLQNQQKASLNQLRTQLALDNAEFAELGDSMEDAARKAELGQRIAATTEELKRQEEALGDYRRSVGNYEKATDNLKEELDQLTQTLISMARAGDTTSDTFNQMVKRAGQLKAAEDQVNTAIDQVGRGTDTLIAVTDATSALTGVWGLWETASALLGKENSELNETMTKMMTIMTALSSLSSIQAALSKTEATYRAAQNVLQLVGINQTKAETKALAAKNAMVNAGNASTKAAAAATWLWNAALSANPVVLVALGVAGLVAGVIALTKALQSNNQYTEASAKALADYKREAEAVNETLELIERKRNTASLQAEVDTNREIEALKARGATELEITQATARAQIEANQREISASKQRQQAYLDEFNSLRTAIALKTKEINAWSGSKKGFEEANTELKELQTRYNELFGLIEEEGANIANLNTEIATSTREAHQAAADAAYEAALQSSQNIQKIREDDLKYENTFVSQNIATRQKYEADLFKVQQDGEKERLSLQKTNGKITQKEYDAALADLSRAARQFYANQTKELNDYYKTSRGNILKLAGQTVEDQITSVTEEYTKAMKDLGDVQAPVRLAGMSDEEFQKELDAYEQFVYQRSEIEARLQKNLQDQITQIKKTAQDKQVSDAEEAIEKQYAEELALASDNERKRLNLENEMLQEQIEARRKAGAETYEQEAQLRANNLALQQLDLNKELAAADGNAKRIYETKKKYLEAQLQAAQGNADAILEIEQQLADNEEGYWEARINKLGEFGQQTTTILSSINDLANALSDRQKEKIEDQYDAETQALADKYAQGLLDEAQYNAAQLKLDKEHEKELAKIERQQAIRDRALATFQVAIQTAQSIMASAQMGFPAAIPFVAMAAALGAVQAAAIWAAPLPEAARGKYIKGPSHADGGVPIEVEGGEVIINRRSTSMFLPLLSAINEMGGGVPFTTPGSDGGYTIRSISGGSKGMTSNEMRETIKEAFTDVKVVATIEDIRREDAKYVEIENAGTF